MEVVDLTNTYLRINSIVKEQLYPFIKLRSLSLLDYTFEAFFNHIIKENNIKILGHHFSKRNIEGLTLIDSEGKVSFSYEERNSSTKQNFTKCHELGHFLLAHQGNFFTELNDGQTSILEVEANYFSACLLMPDIVLLSKIYYQNASLQEVAKTLLVSVEALSIRLLDLFYYLLVSNKETIQRAIENYQRGDNREICLLFKQSHNTIVEEYKLLEPSPEDRLLYLLNQKDFITDNDLAELKEEGFRKSIQERYSAIGVWAYYDKGKTIFYAWDKERLTDKQAYQKARTEYYLQ